ncbi:hypothetical protein MRX96_028130 [Rhipicephalus microplus]
MAEESKRNRPVARRQSSPKRDRASSLSCDPKSLLSCCLKRRTAVAAGSSSFEYGKERRREDIAVGGTKVLREAYSFYKQTKKSPSERERPERRAYRLSSELTAGRAAIKVARKDCEATKRSDARPERRWRRCGSRDRRPRRAVPPSTIQLLGYCVTQATPKHRGGSTARSFFLSAPRTAAGGFLSRVSPIRANNLVWEAVSAALTVLGNAIKGARAPNATEPRTLTGATREKQFRGTRAVTSGPGKEAGDGEDDRARPGCSGDPAFTRPGSEHAGTEGGSPAHLIARRRGDSSGASPPTKVCLMKVPDTRWPLEWLPETRARHERLGARVKRARRVSSRRRQAAPRSAVGPRSEHALRGALAAQSESNGARSTESRRRPRGRCRQQATRRGRSRKPRLRDRTVFISRALARTLHYSVASSADFTNRNDMASLT